FEIRKNLLKFDNVMNDQRKVIYEQRKEMMAASDLKEEIAGMRHEVIGDLIARYIPEKAFAEQWDVKGLHEETLRIFGLDLPFDAWAKEEGIADEAIQERLTEAVDRKMAEKAANTGPELMRAIEKSLVLQILDQNWKEHLLNMDHLRHAIGLRAYGQRDPLNEYKREGFEMFEAMLDRLREQTTAMLSHIEVRAQAEQPAVAAPPAAPTRVAGGIDPNNPNSWTNLNRNADCPCGSGKKYKHCHGRLTA
ncbi:MAG: SEC-C domain-containing protein, partial [Rhodospirillaceae bacterium]|nr:SEC-C domain-containing protein [Rhodospirillaceae bacterium]